MTKYLYALEYKDFVVTHYTRDETLEFCMKAHQKLGPIELESAEGEDIVFGLPDIEGIFVSSKKHSQILDEDNVFYRTKP